jgi:hypothetical protein
VNGIEDVISRPDLADRSIKTQVEVITSVQRRRRWSRAEKKRILQRRQAQSPPRLPVQLGVTPASCSAGASSSVNGHKFDRA